MARDCDQEHTVDYIARMALEMSRLATEAGYPTLTYFLGMVAQEAAQISAQTPVVSGPVRETARRQPRKLTQAR